MPQNNSYQDAWIALTILSSLALITMYGETMLIPALPYLIDDFDISYTYMTRLHSYTLKLINVQ